MARRSSRVDIKFNKFPELQRALPQQINEALGAVAFEGERFVKQSFGTSPSKAGDPPGVDTGKLRNAIYTKQVQMLLWMVSTGDTEYAPLLEFGTSKMAARPFMGPMAFYLQQNAEKIIGDFIKP